MIKVKLDSKAKNTISKTLDLGAGAGSSLIEVPANSRITLNGNKLLQLLIAKKVDVDAELNVYGSLCRSGVLLGWSKSMRDYLGARIGAHMIYPSAGSSSSESTARWTLDGDSTVVDTTILGPTITFKSMLSTIGEKSIEITSSGTWLIPCLALTTSSEADLRFYDLTTEEFSSFITITPITE